MDCPYPPYPPPTAAAAAETIGYLLEQLDAIYDGGQPLGDRQSEDEGERANNRLLTGEQTDHEFKRGNMGRQQAVVSGPTHGD